MKETGVKNDKRQLRLNTEGNSLKMASKGSKSKKYLLEKIDIVLGIKWFNVKTYISKNIEISSYIISTPARPVYRSCGYP
jgi:hypothetical protein